MADRITYHQLAQRLHELGYTDTQKTLNGKPVWLFEHNRDKKATIFLPPMPPDQPVETMHLSAVRVTLKTHGIWEEPPDRFLFPRPNGVRLEPGDLSPVKTGIENPGKPG